MMNHSPNQQKNSPKPSGFSHDCLSSEFVVNINIQTLDLPLDFWIFTEVQQNPRLHSWSSMFDTLGHQQWNYNSFLCSSWDNFPLLDWMKGCFLVYRNYGIHTHVFIQLLMTFLYCKSNHIFVCIISWFIFLTGCITINYYGIRTRCFYEKYFDLWSVFCTVYFSAFIIVYNICSSFFKQIDVINWFGTSFSINIILNTTA